MITYSLKPFEKAFAFQITDQNPAISKFLGKAGSFRASNGWIIKVSKMPEVNIFSKTIYVRGTSSSNDFRIDRTWNLPSNTMRDTVIRDVNEALSELITSVRRYEQSRQMDKYTVYFPDEWDYIVYERSFAPEAEIAWNGKFDSEGWGPNRLDSSKPTVLN